MREKNLERAENSNLPIREPYDKLYEGGSRGIVQWKRRYMCIGHITSQKTSIIFHADTARICLYYILSSYPVFNGEIGSSVVGALGGHSHLFLLWIS